MKYIHRAESRHTPKHGRPTRQLEKLSSPQRSKLLHAEAPATSLASGRRQSLIYDAIRSYAPTSADSFSPPVLDRTVLVHQYA